MKRTKLILALFLLIGSSGFSQNTFTLSSKDLAHIAANSSKNINKESIFCTKAISFMILYKSQFITI